MYVIKYPISLFCFHFNCPSIIFDYDLLPLTFDVTLSLYICVGLFLGSQFCSIHLFFCLCTITHSLQHCGLVTLMSWWKVLLPWSVLHECVVILGSLLLHIQFSMSGSIENCVGIGSQLHLNPWIDFRSNIIMTTYYSWVILVLLKSFQIVS